MCNGKENVSGRFIKGRWQIKGVSKRRNLIQEQLADEIGTSQQTVSRVEKDKLSMSIETLIRLTVYFNVSADYMLGISDLVQPEDSIKIHELVQLYRGLNERDKELVYSQVKRMHELDRKKKN